VKSRFERQASRLGKRHARALETVQKYQQRILDFTQAYTEQFAGETQGNLSLAPVDQVATTFGTLDRLYEARDRAAHKYGNVMLAGADHYLSHADQYHQMALGEAAAAHITVEFSGDVAGQIWLEAEQGV
jgi:hypothetical protein